MNRHPGRSRPGAGKSRIVVGILQRTVPDNALARVSGTTADLFCAYCFAGGVVVGGAVGDFAGGCVLVVPVPGFIGVSAVCCVLSGQKNMRPSTTITAAAIAAQLQLGMP